MDEVSPVLETRFETIDAEEGHAFLQEAYAGCGPRPLGKVEDYQLRIAGSAVRDLRIDRALHTRSELAEVAPHQLLFVCRLRQGRMSLPGADDDRRFEGGDLAVLDVDRPTTLTWHSHLVHMVGLDRGAVARAGAELTGLAEHDVRFGVARPLDAARAEYWETTYVHVHRLLWHQREVPALLRAEVVRLLAAATVMTFPNSALGALEEVDRRSRDGSPSLVRRAVAYIDAHAHTDIGLVEVAAAVSVSPRTLQRAFRTHLDVSPTEYLRRARLAGAHRDLRDADPTDGATVSGIAATWGFSRPGRFAAQYRAAYGRSPRETLRS